MSKEEDTCPSAERHLHKVIAAYLHETDAGHGPGRQELLDRHPDLADALRAFFADHDRMRQAAAARPGADEPTLAPRENPGVRAALGKVLYFGDYELLEEIARGGITRVANARRAASA
jgi:hypothetical protein